MRIKGFTRVSRGLRAHSGVNVRTHNVAVGSLPPRRGARQRARATHPPRELPKTQTTSVKMGEFGVLCSRWSAFWAPRHLKQRPRHHQTGGIAPSKAPTRRRHAVRAPLMLQNPHRSQHEVRRIAYKSWEQHRLARKNSPSAAPPAALPRKSSPNTAPPVALPRKSSPSMRKNAEFGPI